MNNLHKAIGDISSIRRQMARSTEFRGYGPATLAGTAAFAVVAAGVQSFWVSNPEIHIVSYLSIWIWTAFLSAGLIAVQMHTRTHRIHSGLADEMIRMAVEQFLPSGVAGFFSHYRSCAVRPIGTVAATGTLANCFQPRNILVVPFLASTDARRWSMVLAHGLDVYGSRRYARIVTLGNG